MDVDAEGALKFLVEILTKDLNAFGRGGHGVWLPNAVLAFLRSHVSGTIESFNYQRPEYNPVWLAFYDAASELCRRGVFRSGMICPQGTGRADSPGDGYSLTSNGREWLKEANTRYFPTEPSKYAGAMVRPARVLGPAFLQRATEAAKCHQFGNYLACCAMCGAAAESALLAIALAKTGDEESVLSEYRKGGGRQKLIAKIFGNTSGELRRRFETGFDLLTLWRDDAAHGRLSEIHEVEASNALGQLMQLAMLAFDRWTELTAKLVSGTR